MKTFYEMLRILEHESEPRVYLHRKMLGEDEGSPFCLEVNADNDGWECDNEIWVKGYVPNGSENPASRPTPETKWPHSSEEGTTFKNPGRHLEMLPQSIRAGAVEWTEKEVARRVQKEMAREMTGRD